MKTTIRIITLAVGVLAAGSFGALAQDGEKEGKQGRDRGGRGGPGGPGGGRGLPEEVLKEFDKDGDGKLNEEERKAVRAETVSYTHLRAHET